MAKCKGFRTFKERGEWVEAQFIAETLRRGYTVLKPLGRLPGLRRRPQFREPHRAGAGEIEHSSRRNGIPMPPGAQSPQLALYAEAGGFLRGVDRPREPVVLDSGAGAGEWGSFEERADAVSDAAAGERSVSVRGVSGSVEHAGCEGREEGRVVRDGDANTPDPSLSD